ncbi:MAG: DUF1501 domain-containing protein [Planctomycetaceae bacterium]|nr:DUF1501 domain-containing protein [Planctomycetaceae bacterium]
MSSSRSHRRGFLKWCAATGLGLSVPMSFRNLIQADDNQELPPYDGPFYIVFNAAGGWDTTYLMDPKGIDGINRLYEAGDILTQGNHRFAPTSKHKEGGLSNEEFYAEFGRELLTFNGLDYSVNNHSPCSRYMATGKLDSLAYPTFAALVAACQGPSCPLSFLTFGNYSATGNLVAMSRVPYLPSLQRIANADAIEGNARAPYHDDFAINRIEQALADRHSADSRASLLPRSQRAENMLYAAQVNSKALSRITPHIPKENPKQRLAQQAEIALASFRAGVCVSANLSIGQFDSHANNDKDQMKLIPEFLEGIAYVLHRAEDLQIREKLVVIVQSEMGRTPTYNQGDGKDHWSIGSVMFLGPGIEGNRVVGATDDGQFAIPLNPQTLNTDAESGIRIRPEHIHEALRQFVGIADHPHSRKFPLGIRPEENLRGFWNRPAA